MGILINYLKWPEVCSLAVALTCGWGCGQIALDGSLGAIGPLAGPHYQIPEILGKTVGNNLFHSFQSFNLAREESATFTGSANIANVLARVTGGTPSTIDGALRCTIPGANFYFINPAGVTFGANASVDVSGSFAVTTADYLKLGESGRFDARNSAHDVLTIAPPSAFGFLPGPQGGCAGSVRFEGSQLQFKDQRSLTLAAGSVKAHAGALVKAPGGTLRMAAVASEGELPMEDVSTKTFSALGDIELTQDTMITVTTDQGGGQFMIRAHDLLLDGLQAGTVLNNNGRVVAAARPNTIELRGELALLNGSGINVNALEEATGGDLKIEAYRVRLANNGFINLLNLGSGQGAKLDLTAKSVELDRSDIFANVEGSGPGGKISLNADWIRLSNFSYVSTSTKSSGKAGDIHLSIGSLWLGQLSEVTSDAYAGSSGGSGSVQITAQDVHLDTGAKIGTRVNGLGPAGDVILAGLAELQLDHWSSIIATTFGAAETAKAGNLKVQANSLEFHNHSWLSVAGEKHGDAGHIELRGSKLQMDGTSSIGASARDTAKSGAIDIGVDVIDLSDGSYITSTTFGAGAGGQVNIVADALTIAGENSKISAETSGTGEGGNINLVAKTIDIASLGSVSALTTGAGKGGTVQVQASALTVTGDSDLLAATINEDQGGPAGRLDIQAEHVTVAHGGRISTATRNTGDGGVISLNTRRLFLDDGTLRTGSDNIGNGGAAGNIWIQAEELSMQNGATISSYTRGAGKGGSIQATADAVSLRGASMIMTDARRSGNAGQIALEARTGSIALGQNSLIDSRAVEGEAGSISLQAAVRIDLDQSTMTVQSVNGNAGTVSLRAPEIIVLQDSQISAKAGLNGGNITIDPRILGLDDSSLIADAKSGNGGIISLSADFIYTLGLSRVSAISENQSAQQGTVSIRSGVDFAASLTLMTSELLDVRESLREGCARKNPRANSFLISGRGGLAMRPDSFITDFSLAAPEASRHTKDQ